MKLALRRGQQQWDLAAPNHTASNDDAKETVLAWLEQASQAFMQRLIADAEPRVWYSCDAEGRLWWHAHDPVTGRSLSNATEAEMRSWIEQRHASALGN
ncbi:hypothetical protein [Stenomitos frigidus]|uniref:Uncharacterized protein n=1 Tax=Stenomitos frigidus ULC18 TaxID=2107698 RepID=A0A2T1ESJ0_9CYAN|nr:hypothetical protein [Stenomitos frigidus]PSB35663.1 hypothetical protein C7B82_00600 [Stenomitos frigidus ULC18]